MQFGAEKEVEIFKALANKSAYQVGLEYGYDKVYPDSKSIRNAVTNVYNKVQNNAERYGVSQEVVDMVKKGMAERKAALVGYQPSVVEKAEFSGDIKELVTTIRDKTFHLINKKLDRVSNSKKTLDGISFKELGVIAGIAFDKTQILKGEATENIAVLAKIDTNISPSDALKLALQTREQNVGNNTNRG